jgi:diamine N-acetyltransferase
MPKINYIATDAKDIDIITPLRQKTRQYHVERSNFFKDRITEVSIEEQNKKILAMASGGIFLDLAKDDESGNLAGYCLTGINEEKNGVILSIYLEPEYRRQHIGENLMKRALEWMDSRGVKRKKLEIIAGNEEVIDFYRHFNFEVRSILMEQVD